MNLIELPEEFPVLGSGLDRSPGLHLTDIIKDIELTSNPHKYSGARHWNLDLAAEAGFIWEEVLSAAYAERMAVRPPEITLDGIACSPDGVDVDNWIIEEYKCTWMSVRQTPETVWRYRVQGLCYCRALGKLDGKYAKIKWRILYLLGDYKGSGPMYKVFLAEPSEYEIESTWEMIVNHARMRGWL